MKQNRSSLYLPWYCLYTMILSMMARVIDGGIVPSVNSDIDFVDTAQISYNTLNDLVYNDRLIYGSTPMTNGGCEMTWISQPIQELADQFNQAKVDARTYLEQKTVLVEALKKNANTSKNETRPLSEFTTTTITPTPIDPEAQKKEEDKAQRRIYTPLALGHCLSVQLENNLKQYNLENAQLIQRNLGFLDGIATHCNMPRLNRALYHWLLKFQENAPLPPFLALRLSFHKDRGFEKTLINTFIAKSDAHGLINFAQSCWNRYDRELACTALTHLMNDLSDPEGTLRVPLTSFEALQELILKIEKTQCLQAALLGLRLNMIFFTSIYEPLDKLASWINILNHYLARDLPKSNTLSPCNELIEELAKKNTLSDVLHLYKICENNRWTILLSPLVWKTLIHAAKSSSQLVTDQMLSESSLRCLQTLGELFFGTNADIHEKTSLVYLWLRLYEAIARTNKIFQTAAPPHFSKNQQFKTLKLLLELVTFPFFNFEFESSDHYITLHHLLLTTSTSTTSELLASEKNLPKNSSQESLQEQSNNTITSPQNFIFIAPSILVQKAKNILNQFSNSKDPYLRYIAGEAYRKGLYIEKNATKGAKLIFDAANRRDPSANLVMWALKKDLAEPLKTTILETASEKSINPSLKSSLNVKIAHDLLSQNKQKEAIPFLKTAANRPGDCQAQALVVLAIQTYDEDSLKRYWKIIRTKLLTTRDPKLIFYIKSFNLLDHLKNTIKPNLLFDEAYLKFEECVKKKKDNFKDISNAYASMLFNYRPDLPGAQDERIVLETCLLHFRDLCLQFNEFQRFIDMATHYHSKIPKELQYGHSPKN